MKTQHRGQLDLIFGVGFIAVVACALFAGDAASKTKAVEPAMAVQVWFSPKGGCTEAIVKGIDNAKSTIHFSAYEFTKDEIRDALIRAATRGVVVALVVDHRAHSSRHEDADSVRAAGGSVAVDSRHAIHHNKIVVIDSKTVFTGSFNFSDNAELHNAENLIRLDVPSIAKKYVENFELHRSHSSAE